MSAILPGTSILSATLPAHCAAFPTLSATGLVSLPRAFMTSPNTSAMRASFGATLLIVLISFCTMSAILATVLPMNATACGTTHASDAMGGSSASSA
ncbi:hypothetical protein HUO13_34465 [Saccharopolyspora erythraea]|uniref:hypothetical protein n=1 Tax=Saccharopolyspora erythraea TaxID=1836 RepID=UPI001BAD4D2F|nr:hypothetical protein [Saccharopolyspora erythraea]QUH05204.1 hypothetical protein HUO13_34465 [Saccharopolyspora erythraea]